MKPDEIIKVSQEARDFRPTLYLNEKRISDFYDQCLGGITELTTSRELERSVQGAIQLILAKIGGEVSSIRSTSGKMNVSSILKTILIEYYMQHDNKLLETSNDYVGYLPRDIMVKFIGNSTISFSGYEIDPRHTGLPSALANRVKEEQIKREKILKQGNDQAVALAWTASGKQNFASIAAGDWVTWGNITAYGTSPHGLLGERPEEIKVGIYKIYFIVPLWIWY